MKYRSTTSKTSVHKGLTGVVWYII